MWIADQSSEACGWCLGGLHIELPCGLLVGAPSWSLHWAVNLRILFQCTQKSAGRDPCINPGASVFTTFCQRPGIYRMVWTRYQMIKGHFIATFGSEDFIMSLLAIMKSHKQIGLAMICFSHFKLCCFVIYFLNIRFCVGLCNLLNYIILKHLYSYIPRCMTNSNVVSKWILISLNIFKQNAYTKICAWDWLSKLICWCYLNNLDLFQD